MAGSGLQRVLADDAASRADLDLGGLTELLGFNLRMAQVVVYRDFAVAVKDLDVTQKQFAVLSLLDTNPGVSQIALGAALGTDRATMMAIVDRLQDRHLLFRTRSKVDRRRQELSLTDQGRLVLSQARERIAAHETRFTEQFTPAELEQLVGYLRRIPEA